MRLLHVAGRAVVEVSGRRFDVERASCGRFGSDPQQLFARWDEFRTAVQRNELDPAGETDADGPLLSPVPRPGQVFAVGLNYARHAEETGLATATGMPLTFTKFPSSVAGPDGEVVLSGDRVDWEVELVAVIGRRTHQVPPDRAWEHVAGLTVGQDFSDRTVQFAGEPAQFSLGKSFPGYTPMGPALVTPDELDDPDDLALSCRVNGEIVQDGRTSLMIHGVPRLISLLSSICVLLPGDVVFTGTPDGVGMGRSPARFLAHGDVVTSTAEGIGTMTHRCVAAGAQA